VAALFGAGVVTGLLFPSDPPAPPVHRLPAPATPAFVIRQPDKLERFPDLSRWAPIRREVVARESPGRGADAVATVRTQTPEGTSNMVQVIGRAQRRGGTLWVPVRLPSGTVEADGWLARGALGGYAYVRTRLIVDLDKLRATLLRDGKPVFSTVVGVGRSGTPTPTGTFYIRNRLTRYRSPQYGPVAFGTSARSDVLTDWPAGGFVGIHGTDQPGLLPGYVSHGCIRMRNEAIRRLARLMPVGSPLEIQ
jgi:L,D-transpeptidase catalytic domain